MTCFYYWANILVKYFTCWLAANKNSESIDWWFLFLPLFDCCFPCHLYWTPDRQFSFGNNVGYVWLVSDNPLRSWGSSLPSLVPLFTALPSISVHLQIFLYVSSHYTGQHWGQHSLFQWMSSALTVKPGGCDWSCFWVSYMLI